jgi:hypothetical protein
VTTVYKIAIMYSETLGNFFIGIIGNVVTNHPHKWSFFFPGLKYGATLLEHLNNI